MLFNSLEFLLIFMPLVYGVARFIKGRALLAWLSVASFVFYAFAGHAWFLVPMAVTTVLDYWVGRRIANASSLAVRRAYLLLSLVGNLGLLFYFKYSPLIARTLDLPVLSSLLHVILPAGISFYTFQTMSYVIDIYRQESDPEPSFFKYVAFVTFFPHLVAGPLTRHDQLLPQLGAIADRGIQTRWRAGIFLFSIGLAKKVLVADRIANGIDPIIDALPTSGAASAWLAILGYSLQIYFDFSGYSDMAVGLGRLFGIELPRNFDSPYQARNPSDFWRRWHITLSLWLRDYLYISLGGNRKGAVRTQLNLMITMVLGGLWHGANWTFALWGLFHGLWLIVYHVSARRWDALPAWTQRALTYFAVCMAWVLFRASSMAQARAWFSGLFFSRGVRLAELSERGWLVALVIAGTWVAMLAKNALSRDLSRLSRPQVAALAVVTSAAILMMNYSSKFLYFQF